MSDLNYTADELILEVRAWKGQYERLRAINAELRKDLQFWSGDGSAKLKRLAETNAELRAALEAILDEAELGGCHVIANVAIAKAKGE